MKLNAEHLAAKRYNTSLPDWASDDMREDSRDDRRRREGYAAAITEVAQPLQDRVEELGAALKAILELQYSSRLDEAIDAARAILAKHA